MRESKKRRGLSDAEWVVMKALWANGPSALGEIHSSLARSNWAYSTVKTLVRRLVEKGWMKRRRVGNSYLYSPSTTRKTASSRATRDFVNRVFDGVLSPFVATYVEEHGLSDVDLEELEDMIAAYKAKRSVKPEGNQ